MACKSLEVFKADASKPIDQLRLGAICEIQFGTEWQRVVILRPNYHMDKRKQVTVKFQKQKKTYYFNPQFAAQEFGDITKG